jgi:7-keto-8-aminopelargonate synthetase-like enzyme
LIDFLYFHVEIFAKNQNQLNLNQQEQNDTLQKRRFAQCLNDFYIKTSYLGFSFRNYFLPIHHEYLIKNSLKRSNGSQFLSQNQLARETVLLLLLHQTEIWLAHFQSGSSMLIFFLVQFLRDLILYDEFNASISDGIQLSNKACKFNHNDFKDLESSKSKKQDPKPRPKQVFTVLKVFFQWMAIVSIQKN